MRLAGTLSALLDNFSTSTVAGDKSLVALCGIGGGGCSLLGELGTL